MTPLYTVIPAQAGIQNHKVITYLLWVPACAGKTTFCLGFS